MKHFLFALAFLLLGSSAEAQKIAPPPGDSGTGTVSSVTFTGDGTVLSSTPSSAVTTSGTVAATLGNAGAKTVLGNATSGSAAPTYTAAPVLGTSLTVPLVQAASTYLSLVGNDSLGQMQVNVVNQAGANGVQIYDNAYDIGEFAIKTSSLSQANYRFEHRGGSLENAANTTGEWQSLLNVDTSAQYVAFFGNSVGGYLGSQFGIGTASPISGTTLGVNGNVDLAASVYLNWGSTNGTSGYGLRDSSGTMQYKNSGGAWNPIATPATLILQPFGPIYTSDTAGNIFPNFYAGGGGNASPTDVGLGLKASFSADVTSQMRFLMPPVIPSGTLKMRTICMANLTSTLIKYTISDGAVSTVAATANTSGGTAPSGVSLTSETQSTTTWGSADADKYKENKVTLTTVPTAGQMLIVAILYDHTNSTNSGTVTCLQPALIWE